MRILFLAAHPDDCEFTASNSQIDLVLKGHTVIMACMTADEYGSSRNDFKGEPQILRLPTAPIKPIHYFNEPDYPQPRLHRDIERGMAVSVGRLRICNLFDYKFVVLSHNTMRGAAGGAILCAELLIKKGYFSQND